MAAILLCIFRFLRLLGSAHQDIVLENLALRQQLAVFKRIHKRPRLTQRDRWFWISLTRVWKDWRTALVIVHPDTVVRWHRERLRRFWARLSKNSQRPRGRPAISREIRDLVRRIAVANPLWRAPRIHGELQKLGIGISERTISRLLKGVKRPPSQTWKVFLNNHIGEILAMDFFTVPRQA